MYNSVCDTQTHITVSRCAQNHPQFLHHIKLSLKTVVRTYAEHDSNVESGVKVNDAISLYVMQRAMFMIVYPGLK